MRKSTITMRVKMYKPPKINIPKNSIKKGIAVELEHTPSKKIAKLIAQHHLAEDRKYYEKLKKIHKEKK